MAEHKSTPTLRGVDINLTERSSQKTFEGKVYVGGCRQRIEYLYFPIAIWA